MKSDITILSKGEAYPIGDVLAFIVTWEDNTDFHAEGYYATNKDQKRPWRRAYRTGMKDRPDVDLKKILVSEVKNHHRADIVLPAEDRYFSSRPFDGFNPYAEDRFKWHESDPQDIYLFLDSFGDFLTFIEASTQCDELKARIRHFRELKKRITVL